MIIDLRVIIGRFVSIFCVSYLFWKPFSNSICEICCWKFVDYWNLNIWIINLRYSFHSITTSILLWTILFWKVIDYWSLIEMPWTEQFQWRDGNSVGFESVQHPSTSQNVGGTYGLGRNWLVQLLPPKTMDIFNGLVQMMDAEGSFATYRELLQSSTPPILPYLGTKTIFGNLENSIKIH